MRFYDIFGRFDAAHSRTSPTDKKTSLRALTTLRKAQLHIFADC